MINTSDFVVLGGIGNHDLDFHIVKRVNELGNCSLRFLHLNIDKYADGEPDLRILGNNQINGKHVIVFQSAHTGKLKNQFLTLVWAAKKQYGAKSVTAILSFMRYRRQDKEDNLDEINRNLMFVEDMKNKGVDRLILLDIHSDVTLKNCKKEGIRAWNVDSSPAFARHLTVRVEIAREEGRPVYIYSPDYGSIGRAVVLATILNVPVALNLKGRNHFGETSIVEDEKLFEKIKKTYPDVEIVLADAENMKDATVAMREDELSTGKTARMAGEGLREFKVRELYACFTHPVCAPGWKRNIIDKNPFDRILIGNSIPRDYPKSSGGHMTTVPMSNVMAQAVYRVIRKLE